MANPDYEHEAKQAYEQSRSASLAVNAPNLAALASAAASLALIAEIKALRADLASLRDQPRDEGVKPDNLGHGSLPD